MTFALIWVASPILFLWVWRRVRDLHAPRNSHQDIADFLHTRNVKTAGR